MTNSDTTNWHTVYNILLRLKAHSRGIEYTYERNKNKTKSLKMVEDSLELARAINIIDRMLYEDELLWRFTASDKTLDVARSWIQHFEFKHGLLSSYDQI